jgi:DNA-binding GntR family transcriptional regulator
MKRVDALNRAREIVRRLVEERHDRPSLVTAIACEVGAEIIEGIRAPGQDLNSVDLAKRFKTSRTPIREALMLLEKEGLVSVPPRRRPRVTCLNMETIREIHRARAALLEHIAEDIVRNASDDEIAGLWPRLDAMQRASAARDLDAYVWASFEFFDWVTQIAHNKTAKRILDTMLLRTLRLQRLSLSQQGCLERSLDDHARLVRAYEDRDANLAAALLRSNSIQTLAVLEAWSSSRPGETPAESAA